MTTRTTRPVARTGDPAPWLILPARLVLFAIFQAIVALVLGSWAASGAWWPLSATLANLATVALLVWLFRREGGSYRQLLKIDAARLRRDLPVLVAFLVVALPLAYFPNLWLAGWLFGDPQIALGMLVHKLPLWAAIAALAFPLSIVFAELPAYFGYAMPRIEAQTGRQCLSVLLPAAFLAAQHITLPLLFDWRFAVWRFTMFLPFALAIGAVLRWRPSLLPYLMVVHGLLDLSVVVMLF